MLINEKCTKRYGFLRAKPQILMRTVVGVYYSHKFDSSILIDHFKCGIFERM